MILLMGLAALLPDVTTTPAPSSARWVLQVDPALCALERRNVEPAATMLVSGVPGADYYQVTIVGRDITKSASFGPAALTTGPSGKALNGYARAGMPADGLGAIRMDGVAPAFLDSLDGADTVTIAMKSGARATLPVSGTTKAIEAFRRCNADQLIEWGAAPSQFAPGGTRPIAIKTRDNWLSNEQTLAVAAQSKLSEIDAVFRVAISEIGAIDDCRPSSVDTEKKVETAVCAAVINKVLFIAATDASHHPVRGVATFRVLVTSRQSR